MDPTTVALLAIGAKVAVTKLVQGGDWSSADWAGVATQVVDAVVATPSGPDPALQRIELGIEQLKRQQGVLAGKLDEIATRGQAQEFDVYMATGRRYMRDLRDEWRSDRDRRKLVERAQHEFFRAFGIGEIMKDPVRQALADVAIAGTWLWVPSIQDVQKTIRAARLVLERELLYGATRPTDSYADVIRLCRTYGERPKYARTPGPSIAGARIAVQAKYNRWVECAGIEVHVNRPRPDGNEAGQGSPSPVKVKIRNGRSESISVSRTHTALIAELPVRDALPNTNRIAPGAQPTLTLATARPPAPAASPTIGFILPGH